jgi:SPP1 gp7 family putative phage head morphogenesis protein
MKKIFLVKLVMTMILLLKLKSVTRRTLELFLPPEQPFQGGQSGPNNGKPNDGKTQKPMKERQTSPTQNDGNPPKAKANYEMAYSSRVQEEYVTELADSYNSLKNKVANLVEQNKDKDPSVLDAFLVGALIGLFASLSRTSDKYIDELYDNEITSYANDIDFNKANQVKQQLKDWNDSYVHKLAYDIKDSILKNIKDGLPITVAVNKVFSSNMYRVSAMSESVALDTLRQAKIQGNQFAGMSTATWVAHIDDRTCSTCTGLDGKAFGMSDIPPRPHPNCRCGLDFS